MGLHAVTHRKLPRLCSARRFPRRWPHHNSNVTGQIYPSTIWIYLIFDTSATWYNLMQSDSVSSWFFFFVALDAGTGAWESFQSVSLADHGRPVLCPRQYRRVALSHHPDKGGSKQAFVRLQGAKASWWCKIAKHWLIIIYIDTISPQMQEIQRKEVASRNKHLAEQCVITRQTEDYMLARNAVEHSEEEVLKKHTSSFRLFRRSEITGKTKNRREPRAW